MKESINILLLEDNSDDVFLIDSQLKKIGSSYFRILASNRSEFLAVIANQIDIIISDFNLPDLDGFDVLDILKSRHLEVPVIFLSGTIGEEVAVQLMVHGANDCILKDRMIRLVPAIERELKDSKIRKDKKETEQALIIAKEKAEESDRLKTAFLANISHEIRTPLNGIIGFSSLLSIDQPIHKQTEYIDIIEKSGEQLLKIINDIVEISKIEARQLALESSTFDLNEFIDEIYLFYSTLYHLKKPDVKFSTNIFNDFGAEKIIADKYKLKQIISNLLDNAFKFTSSGIITLSCFYKRDEIEFCVKDTGIGIADESHEIIFEHFSQAHNGIRQLYGGTGLGLAICKNLVELMGGRIMVRSKLGSGSEFIFSIPVDNSNDTEAELLFKSIESRFDFKGARILIAEDNNTNYLLLKEFLKDANCVLYHVENGAMVSDLLSDCQNIEIILMDIKMPIMSGIDAFKLIRKKNINIPVIAQTAFTYDYDEEQLIKLGFNDYVSKPIDRITLLKKIDTLLKKKLSQQEFHVN